MAWISPRSVDHGPSIPTPASRTGTRPITEHEPERAEIAGAETEGDRCRRHSTVGAALRFGPSSRMCPCPPSQNAHQPMVRAGSSTLKALSRLGTTRVLIARWSAQVSGQVPGSGAGVGPGVSVLSAREPAD